MKYLPYILGILAATVAAFSALPYGWSHVTASSLAAGLAVLTGAHGVMSAQARVQARRMMAARLGSDAKVPPS